MFFQSFLITIYHFVASFKQKDIPHHPIKSEVGTVVDSTPIIHQTVTLTRESRKNQSVQPHETISHNIVDTLTTSAIDEPVQVQNRKVLNELPQDLISRIKESRKRKTIAVIPPIPNKKRGGPKVQENAAPVVLNKPVKVEVVSSVTLDHDYCSKPYHEQIKKEQTFTSIEEDERAIIMKQPMVKNADGKLMVSLLKVWCFPGRCSLRVPLFIFANILGKHYTW